MLVSLLVLWIMNKKIMMVFLLTCVSFFFSLKHRLLWHGHQVMYNQLASWAVYGILHDPYKEFYISR